MIKQLLLLLLPFALSAQSDPQKDQGMGHTTLEEVQKRPHKSPEEIQAELNDAQAEFEKAKTMFNPWYTGPIVTPSASMMPPGYGNIQPYLYVADNYAAFNEDRRSVSLPQNLKQLIGLMVIQTGITSTVDFVVVPAGIVSWQDDHDGGGFQDLGATIGFLVHKQTPYTPQVKFTIGETFPTGKYKNLSFNGLNLNSTGGGAYSTQFGLTTAKLFFWSTQHPLNTRLFLGYQLSTTVHVENFNSYGGGFGTNGTVRPGNKFSTDLGLELSLTQRWVLAMDIVYTATNRTTFTGHPGFKADHTPASVGGGFSDNLSLAPAIEYNWSPNAGFIGGAWFSVYGRNSLNFAQAVLSITYTFP